jgi:hypothetical protein
MSSPFLWYPGTGNNGLLTTSAVSLMTTELESVTNSSVAVSSVGGTSGVFSNGNLGQAIWADLFFSVGNPGISSALSAGACLAGWFLTSLDGGVTFESTSVAPPRAPDFIIPLPATTISAGAPPFKASGLVLLPALEFKVLIQNNSGQTFGAGSTTAPWLKAAPVATQY